MAGMTTAEVQQNVGALVVIRPDGPTDDGRRELYAQILSVTSSGYIELLMEQPSAAQGWCEYLWFTQIVRADDEFMNALTLVDAPSKRA
jgi:hypothetical protein